MTEIDEWFVAFGEFHNRTHWWDVFTKPRWRHCFAFATTRGAWVIVDPLSNRTGVVLLEGKEIDTVIASVRAQGFPILRMRRKQIHSHRQIEPIYCVSTIKHLLGLRSWRAFTPKGLHDEMIRTGAVPAFV